MNIHILNAFDTYEHRVDLLYHAFIKQGHCVKVWESDYRHIEKKYRDDEKTDFQFIHANAYKKNFSVQRLWSHYKLSKDVEKLLEQEAEQIDLLWVLIPPNSFAKAAAQLKRKYNHIKLVFDLIDLWPETMPIAKIKDFWPFSMWKGLRDNYLCEGDHIVTECNLYRTVLQKQLAQKECTTLYLARAVGENVSVPNLPADRINLCYLGSINNIIDIPAIERIVKKVIENIPVSLHIIGDGEKREELIETIQSTGADVVYHGKLYDKMDKQKVFDQCHYGLNIMKENVCVGLTMKSMDYFEAGLPIINNIHGDTWDAVKQEGIGINETDNFVEEILDLSIDRRRLARQFFENNLSADCFERKVKEIVGEKK